MGIKSISNYKFPLLLCLCRKQQVTIIANPITKPPLGAIVVITAVSNLEAFLRPRFIPKSITLTNGLTLLAAFGGIALYGLLGVVYGPIIMIIIVTSVQMYLDYYQELPKWKKLANRTKL